MNRLIQGAVLIVAVTQLAGLGTEQERNTADAALLGVLAPDCSNYLLPQLKHLGEFRWSCRTAARRC